MFRVHVARLPQAITIALLAAASGALSPAEAASGNFGQQNWCKKLAVRLPGISAAQCQASQLVPTGATSLKGFPILARQIPALNEASGAHGAVRVLLLGGIHGDELTSSSIVFKWLRLMQVSDARQFHWNVVPVLNPDGLLAPRPKRVNANGVDLNRNFPTPDWLRDAPRYWIRHTGRDPRRYPGVAPLSEPESRWLNEEMERFRPHLIISVHAPFGVLDFDGPAEPPRRFGRLHLNQVGVYPGSLGNYSGMHKNVPVITIELPNAHTMPPDAEVDRIWQDMVKWIRQNVPAQPMADAAQAGTSAAASPEKERRTQESSPGSEFTVFSRMSGWLRRLGDWGQ